MARTYLCKSEQHERCDGKILMGAPEPVTVEKCKCKCHKKTEA